MLFGCLLRLMKKYKLCDILYVIVGGLMEKIYMDIISIKENRMLLEEYIKLCSLEWGTPRSEDELNERIKIKADKILSHQDNKLISVLGLIEDDKLAGFISLFKYDGEERTDLTPWYATMYVKKEYRGKGYSQALNDAILKEAKKLGYEKIYLKSDLVNYYEKFGAKYIEELNDGEKLYYIEV